MNHYELLTLISGKYAENELEGITEKINGFFEKHNCVVHYTQHMGRKKLAYPIRHLSYGYYFLVEFDAEAKHLSKLDRDIRLNNDVLRHIIIAKDAVGAPKTFEKEIRREVENSTAPRSSQIPAEFRTLFSENADDTQVQTHAATTNSQTDDSSSSAVPSADNTFQAEKNEQTKETDVSVQKDTAAASTDEPSIPPQDSEEDAATPKKKSKKVSYEELDKKLDELLKDDIL